MWSFSTHLAKRLTRLSGLVPSGTWAAIWGSCVLLLPTMPLISAARVVKCLATLPVGSARIPLCEGVSYGTISAEVVTHRLLLLDWSLFPERIYDEATS